jgi:hypothetical protein
MKTVSLFVLALALGLGTASLRYTDRHNQLSTPGGIAIDTTDGAFRDGLYLGRLAAEAGAEPRVARSRWGTPQDRALFTAGFQQAYSGSLASHRPPAAHQGE